MTIISTLLKKITITSMLASRPPSSEEKKKNLKPLLSGSTKKNAGFCFPQTLDEQFKGLQTTYS